MNGELVGFWRTPPSGSHEFVYADTWLSSPLARPISLSLPLRPSNEPYREGVEAFFDNLLPDNRAIRERIQRRYRTASSNAFDLLREIGRDCVGALQLLPENAAPEQLRQISGQRLTSTGVSDLLNHSLGGPATDDGTWDDDFRISLAGAQEKTALLWHDNSWYRPTGATPTTHIIKLPIGLGPQGIDLTTSVENEWLCGQLLRAYEIPTAPSHIATFGDFQVLVVERFDRKLSTDEKWWIRLPQEDFCQATATPPGKKYESEGGPGIQRIMGILHGSESPEKDRKEFLRTQVIFWLLAATDGHAKNFSIFLLPRGAYRLTPRYDVLSAHPLLGHGLGKLSPQKVRMAMAVFGKNRHYRRSEIQYRHWIETANQCGVSGMSEMIAEIVEQTPRVLDKVRSIVPGHFPESIAEAILGGVASAARELVE